MSTINQIKVFFGARVDLLCYFVATGVMRGSALFIMPLFLFAFPGNEYSNYIIIILLAKIGARFLNLSGSTAILKEGATHPELAEQLFQDYAFVSVLLSVPFFFLYLGAQWLTSVESIFVYLVPMALSESLINLKVHYFRAINKHWHYLIYSLYRFFIEVLLLVCVSLFEVGFSTFLMALFVLVLLPSLPIPSFSFEFLKVIKRYSYTLPIIPTTVLGWILNSSDRIMIKSMIGEEMVIKYSVGYNLASVVLLLTGTLAVWLPPRLFADIDSWVSVRSQIRFFVGYTATVIGLLIFSVLLLKLDEGMFHLFRYYDNSVYWVLSISGVGCYFTGLMAYSSNLLVYFEKTTWVLYIDMFAAGSNVALNLYLIGTMGIVGAALATLISFGLQFGLSFGFATRHIRGLHH